MIDDQPRQPPAGPLPQPRRPAARRRRALDRRARRTGPATCPSRRTSSSSRPTGRRRRSRCRPRPARRWSTTSGASRSSYYDVTYDAPGARRARRRGRRSCVAAPGHARSHRDESRGLDHGAYVPLVEMFPDADVPVLQMSMPTLDPRGCSSSASKLAPLRDAGHPDRRVGLHHPQPALVQPGAGRPTPRRPAPSAEFDALGAGGDGRRGRRRACSTSSTRRRRPARRTRAPSTSRRCSSRSGAAYESTAGGSTARSVIDGFWFGLSKRSWQLG